MSKNWYEGAAGVDTGYVRPRGRTTGPDIRSEVARALASPVVDSLMGLFGSVVAVLNEHRQILAVNDVLLKSLQLSGPASVIGLRPGEALNCVHADDSAEGCGTGETCASCGAALALAAREVRGEPVERECAISVQRDGRTEDVDFRVVALPLAVDGSRFTLLILEDVSVDKRRAALERTFFHDMGNLITALVGASQLLNACHQEPPDGELVDLIHKAAVRLAREVEIQRELMNVEAGHYRLAVEPRSMGQFVADLQEVLQHHPAAEGKQVVWGKVPRDFELRTDANLLSRVLVNALLNALEATETGGQVRFDAVAGPEEMTFRIANAQAIPQQIVGRIFQRYYTTKPGSGRGLGTYAMKLFTERYLEGQVDFITSEQEGTVFRIRLPREIPVPGEG